MANPFDQLKDKLMASERLVLTTHVAPDGDGLGSALGLKHGLARMGKPCRVVVQGPVPRTFDFFLGDAVEEFPRSVTAGDLAACDTVVVLDCSDWGRLADLGHAFPKKLIRICIDHHVSNSNFADFGVVRIEAGATAELIAEFLDRAGVTLDATIALPLYVALVTETGGFAYSNTNAGTHRLAARLIECGLDPGDVHQKLYEREQAPSLALLGRALSRMQVDRARGLAYIALGLDDFAATGTRALDTGGLVAYPRSLEGVELAILMFEDEPGSVKISFRSKGRIDVNKLASSVGGGGHVRASGALIRAPLREALDRVLAAAHATLDAAPPGARA